MRYTIVKYANEKEMTSGVSIKASAHWTQTGRELNVLESYELQSLATTDCRRMNQLNPSGNYAVCPIIEKTSFVNGGTTYKGFVYVDSSNKPIMEIIGSTEKSLEDSFIAKYNQHILSLIKRAGCKAKAIEITIPD